MGVLAEHPVRRLEGCAVGGLRLRVTRLEGAGRSGWVRFELVLRGREGPLAPPVVAGLHSAGGRGVSPWIEVARYAPRVGCGAEAVDLRERGAEAELFAALAGLLPPAGHLMVGCEGAAHEDTYRALLRRVPPAATPLGAALLRAGLPRVRFFGVPEGGREGGAKLFAERPPDAATARAWAGATARELRAFLERGPEGAERAAPRARAAALLAELGRRGAGGESPSPAGL